MEQILLVIGLCLLPLLWMFWSEKRRKAQARRDEEALRQSIELGTNEPVSLHPRIDPNTCIGSGTCVNVCPEGQVLGLIDGRAQLINPSACIGYGECLRNCPVNAITLVLGTEKRSVELPLINANFETNMTGIYIVGELGGMGLIRNAIIQGVQAIEGIAKTRCRSIEGIYDVLIVGAGPAGLGASLAAMRAGLRFITVDQYDLGGTVLQYPRHKIVMTAPVELPLYGKVKPHETTKEALLDLWGDVVKQTGLKIHSHERVIAMERDVDGIFTIRTTKSQYRAQRVILAIGRRGSPRKLGVPGEDLPKVTYRLIEPENFANSHCLVIGGGDSAIEAAIALSEQTHCEVTLSYRDDVFRRAKPKNRERIQAAAADGTVTLTLNSNVVEITPEAASISQNGTRLTIPNDYVFIFIGGELPNDFLKKIGVAIETVHGREVRV